MQDDRLRILREAVKALGLEPADQLRWLEQGQMPVSELAETFDDIYRVVPTMRADGVVITDRAVKALDDVAARLDAMSGPRNAGLWTEAALEGDPHWRELRDVAKVTLRLLSSAT